MGVMNGVQTLPGIGLSRLRHSKVPRRPSTSWVEGHSPSGFVSFAPLRHHPYLLVPLDSYRNGFYSFVTHGAPPAAQYLFGL